MNLPSGRTAMLAILADPVVHVRAPEFFNPRIAARGLDAFLIPLHVPLERFQAAVPILAGLPNLKGFVITIPHKATMAQMCHELGPQGQRTGTVNTVRIEPGGRLVGEMFDGLGLTAGMKADGIGIEGRRILLVGAGGAGRAIAFAVLDEGAASLTIANRSSGRAERLVADLRAAFPHCDVRLGPPAPEGHDLVVNATSLGLHDDDPLPVDQGRLDPAMTVVDIIAVRETPLMQAARARGLRVQGGRPMVDHQLDAQLDFFHLPPLGPAGR